MTRLFVVTGLEVEARIARAAFRHRTATTVGCAAMNAARARSLTATAIHEGAEVVVSFGLCGGLDPALRPGALLLPAWVNDTNGGRFATDDTLRARLSVALAETRPPLSAADMFGADAPVRSVGEKHDLAARYQAGAVDMESHGVLRAAHEAGIPALVLRAVADPADRSVPRAALAGADERGNLRPLAVAGALARRPWEVPAVVRLAGDAQRANAALAEAALCLAELFGRD